MESGDLAAVREKGDHGKTLPCGALGSAGVPPPCQLRFLSRAGTEKSWLIGRRAGEAGDRFKNRKHFVLEIAEALFVRMEASDSKPLSEVRRKTKRDSQIATYA